MTSVELAELAGITYRQLDFWTRRGWLSAAGGVGSGHQREYSAAEVKAAVWMAKLVKAGFDPDGAALIVRDKAARMTALAALTDGWLEESA